MNALTRAVLSFWDSSIGKKILVAVTGVALLLFLPGHLIGNLLLFAGKDAINEYALWLHELGHGGAVWLARIGLLTVLVVHILLTIQLTLRNREASQKYSHPATTRASRSSRMMIWSGLTILAFIVYHISHFTVRIGNDYNGSAYLTSLPGHDGNVHNVHQMMVDGFSHVGNTLFYIIAITLLCSHLSHGFSSVFQTLGLRSRKSEIIIKQAGRAYALLIWAGFLSMPVAILFFGYGSI
ncbi:MAG: succinate dehydrogenase cytochrome b subunit [Roseibacillus sp.]|nr:succinate dehydrogenase cytochrome b subunit [Roseibacillus sp.]